MSRNETRRPNGWLWQEFRQEGGRRGRWAEALAGRRQTGRTAHQEVCLRQSACTEMLTARDDSWGDLSRGS